MSSRSAWVVRSTIHSASLEPSAMRSAPGLWSWKYSSASLPGGSKCQESACRRWLNTAHDDIESI